MKYTHFSKEERSELSILRQKGYSLRAIGEVLGKSHSSLSRELRRNKGTGNYEPQKAHHKAYVKRKDSKYQGMKVRSDDKIQTYVEVKMKEDGWSPENIAGRLNYEQGGKIIGKDAIYKYIYSHHGQSLCEFLKYKRIKKKKRKNIKTIREIIKDRVFIDQRPSTINERKRFGDYEGDTMGRPKSASMQTLTVMRERLSRKIFAIKVSRLKYSMNGFKKILGNKQPLSLTLDNGVENTRYKELRVDTYFCHPYHSWEKGSVEQGIGLIREYIPKKADLKDFPQAKIDAILERINSTPMKCLNYKTPNEVYAQHFLLSK